MSVIQRVVKPITRKGKRILLKREPQIHEGVKQALFLQGRKTSENVRNLMSNLYDLKKPDGKRLSRKHDITVFENPTLVEDMCRKSDSTLFVIGSHSKKRPDNLVIGRMFDYTLLDMVELGIEGLNSMRCFVGSKITLGCKPLLVFNGPEWEQSQELKHLKSIFIDFFHREHVDAIRLQGLEHALSFTVNSVGKILLRSYKICMKKSGMKTPRIELEEMGPRVDFSLRRSKLPSEDLLRLALKQPKLISAAKHKNLRRTPLGNKEGRVHLGKQDINKLQTRKMKGLKRDPAQVKLIRKRRALMMDANNPKAAKVA